MRKIDLLAATGLGGVLTLGVVGTAFAQSVQSAATVDEVIVTATRRAQDVTTIPYNISAVGAEQLERSGVKSFEALTAQVPNLSLNSVGNRAVAAQRPVIRGLNASAGNRPGQAQEQAPVASYIGNVPSPAGLFPIEDVERVEVLRGPQGTLYGAGALGGAVRIIPTDPQLGDFGGEVAVTGGILNHSDENDYGLSGVVNIPLGETLALRVSGAQSRDAGFVDKIGVFVREGNHLSQPKLAIPGNVANSPAILRTVKDANWGRTTSARLALKWTPTDALDVVVAYNLAEHRGEGGPVDNPGYGGGPDPLDPRLTYPALDEYEVVLRGDEPYKRGSQVGSLDVSFDAGFATLSSTTSYMETNGQNVLDGTYGTLSLPAAYRPYYTGDPANPRFASIQDFVDESEVFTQEVRAVSNLDGPVQYVVGAFYQRETRSDTWYIYIPGTPAQAKASGGLPVFAGPGDQSLDLAGDNTFTDSALFGELSWEISDAWQVTGGVRLFRQTFERAIDFKVPLFGIFATNSNKTEVSDAIFKVNTSYEWRDGQQVYATFSQGFRRGGANSFATAGIVGEPASLLDYEPDTVDNFEVGVKGRLDNGFRYTADIFIDNWDKPQIGIFTPVNVWPVVVNGKKAQSKGFEAELSGALTTDLDFVFGYAYADAKLTEDFCLPVGNGGGGFIPCGVQGKDGARLPGSPKHSATANLVYGRELSNGDDIELAFNANYRGDMYMSLPAVGVANPKLPGFWTLNASAAWTRGPWEASVYARNLLDERNVLAVNLRDSTFLGTLDDLTNVTRPRAIGAQLRYRW